MSSSMAASSQGARNYSSAHSAQSSSSSDVPANCVRQECGKLWCWQMGSKR